MLLQLKSSEATRYLPSFLAESRAEVRAEASWRAEMEVRTRFNVHGESMVRNWSGMIVMGQWWVARGASDWRRRPFCGRDVASIWR